MAIAPTLRSWPAHSPLLIVYESINPLMSLASWYDSIPFHFRIFSISAPTLTYHDARNRHDASRELCKPT